MADNRDASKRVQDALTVAFAPLRLIEMDPAKELAAKGVALLLAQCATQNPNGAVFTETDCCTMVDTVELVTEDVNGQATKITTGAAGLCAMVDPTTGAIKKLTVRRKLQPGETDSTQPVKSNFVNLI